MQGIETRKKNRKDQRQMHCNSEVVSILQSLVDFPDEPVHKIQSADCNPG